MKHETHKPKVLFLCTGNACRSQMAEGWAKTLLPESIEAWSAGTLPKGVDPLAIHAMRDAGVDISAQESKHVDSLRDVPFDFVISLCDQAANSCPVFSGGAKVLHMPFDDPPRLAAGAGTEAEALVHYGRVRDEIRDFVARLPELLAQEEPRDADAVREIVREGYGAIAGRADGPSASSCCGSACGADGAAMLAQAMGYSGEELAGLPEGANLGLSCGNPTALAGLRAGETVLDLGSGAGFDVFIAGPKVGAGGRAIGVDMTPQMLAKARRAIPAYRTRTGLDNVEFRLGEIEHLPVADASIDAIISNCVLNLSPDKPQVWREMARVLKPGGRVAVSDIALVRPLPAALLKSLEGLVGCISGAVTPQETEAMAQAAGFTSITMQSHGEAVDAMLAQVQDTMLMQLLALLPPGAKPSDYIVSLGIQAVKP